MAWSYDYGRAFYISNMIALTYKGKLVELRPGARLNITGSNPAFDPAAAGRVFSFPFSVPVSPANAAVFKHLQRLDAKQQVSSDKVGGAGGGWIAVRNGFPECGIGDG